MNDASNSLNSAKRSNKNILIGVVGPCGSGKSTLVSGLEKYGYKCRHIAQEHSYVQYMWRHITNPDILIYLQASFESSTTRRKLNWAPEDHSEQLRRLAHALHYADIIIDTDRLSVDEVLNRALDFLRTHLP